MKYQVQNPNKEVIAEFVHLDDALSFAKAKSDHSMEGQFTAHAKGKSKGWRSLTWQRRGPARLPEKKEIK